MARKVRFRVVGRLDHAAREQVGTVIINRATGLVEVRPLYRRRTYALMLSDVASMICASVIKRELFEKRIAKAKAKRK